MSEPVSVLIVDDNPANLRLAADVLEAEGFSVARTTNAQEALAALSLKRPDVILMDLAMPEVDGLTLTRKIKSEGLAPGVPIVALTASAMRGDEARATAAGCDGYIVKPIDTRSFPSQVLGFAPVSAAPATGGVRRALVVDDREMDRKLLRDILTDDGWEVIEAEDGVKALEILNREHVDAIISDVLMPRMDGYRLCYEVRKDPRFQFIPHVIHTNSYTSPSDERLALELGATRYIRKPVSGGELLRMLNELVKKPAVVAVKREPPEELEFMKEYSQRLVSKLVENNEALERRTEELRRSREQLDSLLNSLDGVVFEFDLKTHRFNYVSAHAEALLGYPVKQWREEEDFCLHHVSESDRATVLENIDRASKGETHTLDFEFSMIASNGNQVWLRAAVSAVEAEGGIACLRGILLDMTERHSAERRRAMQYSVSQALAETAVYDGTGQRIIQIICEHTGWPVGELWVRNFATNNLVRTEAWHDPGNKRFETFIRETGKGVLSRNEGIPGMVWNSGQAFWSGNLQKEALWQRKTASEEAGLNSCLAIPVSVRKEVHGVLLFLAPAMAEPDRRAVELFASIASQIALFLERRRLEEDLRHAQKMEAVGMLAGGIAHDFNNMLTVIEGHAAILLDQGNLDPHVADSLAEIRAAAGRAATLTAQLLTFSRKQPLRPQVIDLNVLIANLNKMFYRLIREDVNLQIESAKDLPPVRGDRGMLEQILMNLVVNARDAMPNGGKIVIITESISLDDASVELHAHARPGRFVRLTVRDTGIGIPTELLPRIFEPFFTTKPTGKGTGLGLATVHGIVEQHGGWVEVESVPGQGTAFKVYLPTHVTETREITDPEKLEPWPTGKETILLVEDEASLRALTATILGRLGYKVLEASSGAAALEIWAQHKDKIQLVLSDVIMPGGLSGRDLIERLRKERPTLKTMLSTGYESELMDSAWAEEHGVHFLQKPFKPRGLAVAVRAALDK